MTYNNAVKQINSLPETSAGGTERLRQICAALGSPQKQIKSIQICGDAGKSSCAEMLGGVLSESGYKVGCHSLSYVSELRERITVGGKAIPHAAFADYAKRVLSLPTEAVGDAPLSQNEIIFIISLMYFADSGCDTVIFERQFTRADSSVLDAPILSIVTSVLDNVSSVPLRDVIHRGTRETVTCIQHKDVYTQISEACADVGCRLSMPIYAELEVRKISLFKTAFTYRGREYSIGGFSPCQLLNAITVIEAAHALARLGMNVSDEATVKGLDRAHLPITCRTLAIEPTIIVASVSNETHLEAFFASMAQVSDLITGKLSVYLSPDASCLGEQITSRLSSCLIGCDAPVTLPETQAPEFKMQIKGIAASITATEALSSAAVFIGSREYVAELTQQIQKDLGNIL